MTPKSRFTAVRIIILMNVAVFICWHFPIFSNPDFMPQNFLVSWDGLTQGRIWTLLTSVFSHNWLFHIFINMIVLASFGRIMERVLGTVAFVKFYLMAGIVSSLTHCLTCLLILKQPEIPALGASGAISGLVILFSLMFPNEKLLLFFIIPVRALYAVLIVVALDLWGLIAQARGGTSYLGHGAHLGGALAGALYYYFYMHKARMNV